MIKPTDLQNGMVRPEDLANRQDESADIGIEALEHEEHKRPRPDSFDLNEPHDPATAVGADADEEVT